MRILRCAQDDDAALRLPAHLPPPPTVGVAVGALAATLAAAGAPDARATARDVIAALLDVPRSWPLTHRDAPCDARCWAAADRAVRRIAAGAPFAYAVGRAPFRHLTLEVDERVLIPRPETELLVDLILAAVVPGGLAIDIGTGSGAIALALATEGAFDRVVGTDVSLDALAVAARNVATLASALEGRVELRHGSLLGPVAGERARVVVSNPPYIAYEEAADLPAAVRDWEPPVALFSGDQGLGTTSAIIRDATAVLERGGLLAVEVDSRRATLVARLVTADPRYQEVAVRLDLTGRERFVTARRA